MGSWVKYSGRGGGASSLPETDTPWTEAWRMTGPVARSRRRMAVPSSRHEGRMGSTRSDASSKIKLSRDVFPLPLEPPTSTMGGTTPFHPSPSFGQSTCSERNPWTVRPVTSTQGSTRVPAPIERPDAGRHHGGIEGPPARPCDQRPGRRREAPACGLARCLPRP